MGAAAHYDYVVAGGGSAGSVVAGRLAAAGASVLVLEAGETDRSPNVAIPAQVRRTQTTRNWKYQAEPDPTRDGKVQQWSAGKSLGGGGSVNSMVFVRGNRGDYDSWEKRGCSGWGYESLLPSFKRLENWTGPPSEFRGTGGPIGVAYQGVTHHTTDAFIAAGVEAGHRLNPDYNGEHQDGVAVGQVNQRRGLRSHASREYLRRMATKHRPRVLTGATVRRIVVEHGRAVGVEYVARGRISSAFADSEVILSAGALASPKILLLSGVGPRDELERFGIPIVAELPGVGRNLQEHPSAMMLYHTPEPTINRMLPRPMARAAWQFVRHGTGPIAASAIHAHVYQRLDADAEVPQAQTGFASFAAQPGVGKHGETRVRLLKENGVMVWSVYLHPRSRGRIRLRSADASQPPIIDHELLAEHDMSMLLRATEATREIMSRPALRGVVGDLFEPERSCVTRRDWIDWVRQRASTGYHPVGTCQMGLDEDAVVDPTLRVHGLRGLRVIDASIMPTTTSGNTNAPAMMIGERGAELVLTDV